MNKKRRAVMWIGIITIIPILLVAWLFPPHWWLILLAAYIIIFGTALSLLFEEWKERNWQKWVRAVFTGLVLTAGALVSTYAWDLKSEDSQKRNLIRSLAQELSINRRWLDLNSKEEPSDLLECRRTAIPTFKLPRTTVLNAVVSSGLLDLDHAKEERLFWAVVKCEQTLHTAADMLRLMNESIVNAGPIESRVSVAKLKQKKMRESEWFTDSQDRVSRLAELLSSEFTSIVDIEGYEIEEQKAIQKPSTKRTTPES